ncbi:unnamed protein product, partial [Iphiclides podalirius]
MPEPLPLPPEPPGKKKKAKPKKEGKKKKGELQAPPPEPVIQSGQSVLFTSSAELLTQNMKKFPMEISLWNKEDNMVFIGSTSIPWDPIFFKYLEALYTCQETPPVTLNEEYNIFEEGTAKLIAKVGIQVKLSYLGEKVTAAFRTLSEDPVIKKVLYTGMNSKTTSYMCTMKTTDEVFEENCNKIENNYIIDKPKPMKVVYADYKNAPGAKYNIFNEGDYCCMNNADKPPSNVYKSPETCPDIDFIIEYVRKIITSCNDNMRMLTPRPTIKPRIKATDIDRLCYCKETKWPDNEISQRLKKEVQSEPCPLCTTAEEKPGQPITNVTTFDLANIRGPCGRHDCKIARHIRAYIENLVAEDNEEISIDDIIGPCGSKECTLAEKIQQFLRREGVFNGTNTLEGLSTQCACIQQMQESMKKNKSDDTSSGTTSSSESSDSEKSHCGKKGCPFGENVQPNQVYNVFYFFVQYDLDNKSTKSPSDSIKSSNYRYCASNCPSARTLEKTYCSKSACSFSTNTKDGGLNREIQNENLPDRINGPSPDDSDIVINFDDIYNPCCVKSCNVVETVKDFIVQGINRESKVDDSEDPCYCDCECTFKFSNKTTYCAVCGGYECLGDDLKDMPDHAKPYPCPVYNKLYDKKYIKVQSPWPQEEVVAPQKQPDSASAKSSKMSERKSTRSVKSISERRLHDRRSDRSEHKDMSARKVQRQTKQKKETKPIVSKVEKIATAVATKMPQPKYPYPAVPKNMGWLWTAEDIPGLKGNV